MDKPLVSIGVPTYNRPKTLERTLASLLAQSYKDIEVVVSDNGSTDTGVEAVLSKFSNDSRVVIYRHNRNQGAIFNFNFILDKFHGEYVMRIGDDDWLDENYIEACVSFLMANPAYVCAYGSTKIFDAEGQLIKIDTDLSLDQASAEERMRTYYEYVTQNGIYFGLLKKDCISYIKADRLLADDWLGVARLCFKGKIKMLKNTHLNITAGGTGRSVDSMVDGLGISDFNRYFPYLSVCMNVYRDILFRSNLFKKLRLDHRVRLANTCVKTLYRRFNVKGEIKRNYLVYLKSFA